ncbi:MAG: hypothetical protein IH956_07340 [Chloroflexi bacterium]|nr:hypothetical protein [Chloroflexota bacterium]
MRKLIALLIVVAVGMLTLLACGESKAPPPPAPTPTETAATVAAVAAAQSTATLTPVLTAARTATPRPTATPVPTATASPLAPIEGVVPETLSFEVVNLADLYESDEAAADVRVKGKLVEVTGTVFLGETNKSDVAYVLLSGSQGRFVQCVFTEPGPKEPFSDLRVLRVSTVRGIVEGKSEPVYEPGMFGSVRRPLADLVTLSDCFVVK